jgi:dTMP kinase
MAYQGARGIDVEEIRRLNEEFAPVPDLVIIFDVPVDVGLERIKANRRLRHYYFERHQYLEKVAGFYQQMKAANIVHIDATRPVEKVAQEVVEKIEKMLDVSRRPSDG